MMYYVNNQASIAYAARVENNVPAGGALLAPGATLIN